MSGLFSRPKIPAPPSVPAYRSPPDTIVATEMLDEDMARKRAKLSRPKSVIAGDLTPSLSGRKETLG